MLRYFENLAIVLTVTMVCTAGYFLTDIYRATSNLHQRQLQRCQAAIAAAQVPGLCQP